MALNLHLKLSIRQRIVYGFLLLITTCSAISIYNIYNLRHFHQSFQQYQKISHDTIFMLEIDKNILNLQRAILTFNNAEKAISLDQALLLTTEINSQLKTLNAQGNFNLTDNVLLTKLQNQLDKLQEKIESLPQQKAQRNTLVQQQFPEQIESLNKLLNQFFNLKNQIKNSDTTYGLWEAAQTLNNIRTLANQYFNNHEFAIKQKILAEYKNLNATTHKIQQVTQKNQEYIVLFSQLTNTINDSEKTFHKAVQADRNYLFLVNIVLAGDSAELTQISDELKLHFVTKENALYTQTSLDNQRNQTQVLIISCIASALAIIIAIFIGRRISDPIVSITHTFDLLTQGQLIEHIPGTHRNDEIGQLAKAANVFREKNLQTQNLLTQSQAFADELARREKALEQAATRAKEANLAKSQFLANMSHELRTPMNAILGMLSLLQKTSLTEQQTDYTRKTELAARSLLTLLNDILDLSKAEAGKIELDPTPFRLSELLENLRIILSSSLAKKPVELLVSVPDNLPDWYQGDALRLQQVLLNLGSNAIKFTESGNVKLSIAHTQTKEGVRRLTFCVSDTGIGIAPENQAKIFNGFTQAESSTTRRFGGTGLGLAISQHLVELMGGHLSLTSKLGSGSRFFFSVDLPEVEAETADKAKTGYTNGTESRRYRLNGLRILLVEDNPTNQQIAQELLEIEGAQVDVCNNGLEAVTRLTDHQRIFPYGSFDAVLMDLQMPMMDGLTATGIIRTQLKLHHLPIIAMTANTMATDREICLKAGMNDHVGKPFELDQLVNTILQYTQPHFTTAEAVGSAPKNQYSSAQTSLDIKNALARMGGNKELYLRMLPRFEDNLKQLSEELMTHLQANDYPSIAKQLHTLKGLAATMGFSQLATSASESEKLFKLLPEQQAAAQAATDITQQIAEAIAQLKDPEILFL